MDSQSSSRIERERASKRSEKDKDRLGKKVLRETTSRDTHEKSDSRSSPSRSRDIPTSSTKKSDSVSSRNGESRIIDRKEKLRLLREDRERSNAETANDSTTVVSSNEPSYNDRVERRRKRDEERRVRHNDRR